MVQRQNNLASKARQTASNFSMSVPVLRACGIGTETSRFQWNRSQWYRYWRILIRTHHCLRLIKSINNLIQRYTRVPLIQNPGHVKIRLIQTGYLEKVFKPCRFLPLILIDIIITRCLREGVSKSPRIATDVNIIQRLRECESTLLQQLREIRALAINVLL